MKNALVHRAEAHAVCAVLEGSEISIDVVRDFARARTYWLQTRLVAALGSCLFVDALLARLRNDRSGFELAATYFGRILEGDFASLQHSFLTHVRKGWRRRA